MTDKNLRRLAHELAMEYLHKHFAPRKDSRPDFIVGEYLDAYLSILEELEKSPTQMLPYLSEQPPAPK